ncbi:MAG TPA: methyltransferase domain-containing protein [Anaerolineae bacterium]|nr:methyltransferase domain-containing protein [Anaerolineae bacterium]
MNDSLAFDRAAAFYDDTRQLPAAVSERITRTILELVPPGQPILEAGTGTGRIAAPLLKQAAPLFGVDLSIEMMRRLRAKHPQARLAQADISRLPFPDAAFGAILTVHVLHLVGSWRAALREFRRTLEPGGVYLNSHNYRRADSPNVQLRSHWHALVEARGHTWRRPGAQDHAEVLNELRALGAQIEEIVVAEWSQSVTPQQELDAIAHRVHSDTWNVPDEVLNETLAELRAWAEAHYPDRNTPLTLERRFIFDVIHF